MRKNLILKIKESLAAVLPITLIMLILVFTIAPVELGTLSLFLIGAIMLIVGMGLFTLGADMAMMPMGNHMGAHLTKQRKLPIMIGVAFAMGVLITVAEPDLTVLAQQVPAVPDAVVIWSVALGVGIFLAIALVRIIFQIPLSRILIIVYGGIFLLSIFGNPDYFPVAFDSGGVTTGPITVPFILAFGIGVAGVRGGKNSQDDSFGLVALCSAGPILAVTIMGMFYPASAGDAGATIISNPNNTWELLQLYGDAFPGMLKEVGIALLPIVVLFAYFQVRHIKLPKSQVLRMGVGVLYTYVGLVLFLVGVNVGFMPMGSLLGFQLASLPYNWVLVPIGMLVGYNIVKAEPAVHVLVEQVEEITGGTISKKLMMSALSIGMAVSVGLSLLRVLLGISLVWFLVPGYMIAIGLTFFVPKIFTAIAFDSGGVASGPMTATFLLPLAMGACNAVGGNLLTDAFGIVAMVAMTPLIAIQLLGLVYRLKDRKQATKLESAPELEEIIDLEP